MEVNIYKTFVQVLGNEEEVRHGMRVLMKAGFKYDMGILRDYDLATEAYFGTVNFPQGLRRRARALYLAIRLKAVALGCEVYIDGYGWDLRRMYLYIKGPNAHDRSLAKAVSELVAGDNDRIRSYTNHPRRSWTFHGVEEPALSVTLTGLGIIRERRRRPKIDSGL